MTEWFSTSCSNADAGTLPRVSSRSQGCPAFLSSAEPAAASRVLKTPARLEILTHPDAVAPGGTRGSAPERASAMRGPRKPQCRRAMDSTGQVRQVAFPGCCANAVTAESTRKVFTVVAINAQLHITPTGRPAQGNLAKMGAKDITTALRHSVVALCGSELASLRCPSACPSSADQFTPERFSPISSRLHGSMRLVDHHLLAS